MLALINALNVLRGATAFSMAWRRRTPQVLKCNSNAEGMITEGKIGVEARGRLGVPARATLGVAARATLGVATTLGVAARAAALDVVARLAEAAAASAGTGRFLNDHVGILTLST